MRFYFKLYVLNNQGQTTINQKKRGLSLRTEKVEDNYEETKNWFICNHRCIVHDINRVGWGECPLGLFGSWSAGALGELDPAYSACSEGKNQSPVNLTGMIESDLSPITINYRSGGNEILNNGHAIQVNYKPGSTITVSGHEFELKQFHFHSPSEDTIEGYSYPMEAHFVHADKEGNYAVIAVMFKTGEKNAELEKAWAHMPENAGEKNALPKSVDANILLPHNHNY